MPDTAVANLVDHAGDNVEVLGAKDANGDVGVCIALALGTDLGNAVPVTPCAG